MALKGFERLSISKFVSRGPEAPSGTVFFESRIGASELMRALSAPARIAAARVDRRARSQILGRIATSYSILIRDAVVKWKAKSTYYSEL
jgi:hypothetical protein